MQQFKGITKLSEINHSCKNSDILSNTFARGLQRFNISPVHAILNKAKSKGVDCSASFKILFLLPFINIVNTWVLLQSGYSQFVGFKKDVLYTFLKNPFIDWRKIVFHFAKQFLSIVKKNTIETTSKPAITCLILDDSLLPKTGKAIEFIGKVYDHCTHKYQLGMKLLTLGFWDGTSFIPLDFSLHNELGKDKKRGLRTKDLDAQYTKQRADDCASMQRIKEIPLCKISTGLSMIKAAVKNKIVPQYVLADSWFISDNFFKEIATIAKKAKEKINVIGLMKTNRKISLNGKIVLCNLLPELHHSKIKTSRTNKCNYLEFKVTYKDSDLKIFLVKMNGQQTWKMLVTTDLSLSFSNAMKYYQIRWSIEVFFKDAKQNLYLGKCQSTNFDAQIASISIAFTNYITLALTKRFESYETMGEMFRNFKDTMLQQNIMQKLWSLVKELFTLILAELGVDIELLIQKIINSDTFLQKLEDVYSFQLNNLNYTKT